MKSNNFWEVKTLDQLNRDEWESLCDGCARCCLLKLQEDETDLVYYTNLHCEYLDLDKCHCQEYQDRSTLVPDCVTLTAKNLENLSWMPSTCAYRLLYEKKPLPSWHPLISGSQETVHDAGISIRSFSVCESNVEENNREMHIIEDFS